MNHLQKVHAPAMRSVRRQVAAAAVSSSSISPFHSISEPSFVYRGWHEQSRSAMAMLHRSSSSYHFEESGGNNNNNNNNHTNHSSWSLHSLVVVLHL
mmetsp:Transcript_25939/g.43259  ORF Transcript_25939/g.43259 Transcript_25939/m.43259 type:complete len:97 (+) Transcript_25939:212-502(+)